MDTEAEPFPALPEAEKYALAEENRRLVQRLLEQEEVSRREIERLKAANERLMHGESHMRRLLDSASFGFLILDREHIALNANQSLCTLLGGEFHEITGGDFRQFVYVGGLPAFSALIEEAAAPGGSGAELDLVGRDGRIVNCRLSAASWNGEDGVRKGTFVLALDNRENLRNAALMRDMQMALHEAEKNRENFLAVVGRELQAPTGGIIAMIRMLLETQLTDRQREFAGVIHSSASVLIRLVDDLIESAALDSRDRAVHPRPEDPAELVESAANFFRVRAEEKGIVLKVAISPSAPPLAMLDAVRIRRVLLNLLENAFKFTERGQVTLTLDVMGGNLRFMVSDTGAGIEPELRNRLFQDYMAGSSPIARRYGGLGLGLSISRRIVQLMGGRIGVESEPGHGSAFHFTVPMVAPKSGAVPAPRAEKPEEKVLRLPPLRILVADDNRMSQRLINAYLMLDGHRVAVVDNGLAAAERCAGDAFDVAILDSQMPNLDGEQTLRLIRDGERSGGRRTPVVILAPAALAKSAEEYRSMGADGMVKRPVTPEELMSAIAAAAGVEPLAVARESAPVEYAADDAGGAIRRIDGSQFISLKQVMAEEHFVGIMRLFLENAVPEALAVKDMLAADAPDFERIGFASGKARALADYLGFSALAQTMRRIENAIGDHAPLGEVRRLAAELPMITDDTLEELRRIHPGIFSTLSGAACRVPISKRATDNAMRRRQPPLA